jgi:hypothetical protein
MALNLYGRVGRLTAESGIFWRGQYRDGLRAAVLLLSGYVSVLSYAAELAGGGTQVRPSSCCARMGEGAQPAGPSRASSVAGGTIGYP